MEERYILTLDIGTTTIRSFIYNSRAEIVGKAVDYVLKFAYISFIFLFTYISKNNKVCKWYFRTFCNL